MKLWEKGSYTSSDIEKFTVGQDRELDLVLARYDVLGSLAHVAMLARIDLLKHQEWQLLRHSLIEIYQKISSGSFTILEGVEDVHSQVELIVTEQLGEVGKKIHSGRSRNDQVLLDIKLYLRDEIQQVTSLIETLAKQLLQLSDKYKEIIIPGYTHMQAAMPSSFGLWFGAFAESLVDDLKLLHAAFQIVNQNPLGSAAGYGNSFPLDRQLTTELLGFAGLHVNVVAAQLSRGKTETSMAFAMASTAGTLNKLATDICLYNSQNFGFLSFPDHITTGSSIMPHKKNPDVFELIRGRCNIIQQLPSQLIAVCSNLPTGYHRDMQITKEILIPEIQHLKQCLSMVTNTITEVTVTTDIMEDSRYDLTYSVEHVNKKVLEGIPFREAYQQIAKDISDGSFVPQKELLHTHIGSIGNLGNDQIRVKLETVLAGFNFEEYEKALYKLIHNN